MKWVSVGDRLPKERPHRMEYLLLHKKNGVVYEGMYNSKTKKFMNNDFSEVSFSITHWMQLPEPPPTTSNSN